MLTITKTSIFFEYATKEKYVKIDALNSPPDFLTSLNARVMKIEEGLTLFDLLDLLTTDTDISDLVSALVDANIRDIHNRILLTEDDSPPAYDEILVAKSAEIFISQYQNDNWENASITASGRINNDHENYALDLTLLKDLANIPIKISDKSQLIILGEKYEERSVLEFKTNFTFFEFLQAIFRELSFVKDEDKLKVIESLKEASADAQAHPEKLIPWEEVKDRIFKKE